MIASGRKTEADPALMLAFLRDKASDRKLRLFACACCRLVWRLLPAQPGRARVEAMELGVDGRTAIQPAAAADAPIPRPGASPCLYADVASIFVGCSDAFAAALVTSAMAERTDPCGGGRAAQAAVLADLFDRPRAAAPRWRTPEVVTLAQAIYDRRRFQDMPRLAVLLEAAGCSDRDLLLHCLKGGAHVRGCWALDLLLGKS